MWRYHCGIILKPFAWLLLLFYNYFGYGVALMLFADHQGRAVPRLPEGKKSMIQMNMLSGKCRSCKAVRQGPGAL